MDEQQSQEQAPAQPQAQRTGLVGVFSRLCTKCKIFAVLGVVLFLAALVITIYFTRGTSESVEIIKETPNGNVAVLTPPQGEAPFVTPEIVKDNNGREYVTGEIMVEFHSDVTQEQAQKIILDAGATVKQHFTNMPLFLVGISSPGADGVSKAVFQFQTMKEVKNVGPNYITQAPTP